MKKIEKRIDENRVEQRMNANAELLIGRTINKKCFATAKQSMLL